MGIIKLNKSVDKLGRLVIPREIRTSLSITIDTIINIQVKNNHIILTPTNKNMYCRCCKSQLKVGYNYCYECGILVSDTDDNL